MYMSRGVFQTLGMLIIGAIATVWLFVEDPGKIMPTVILASLFIILSLEYIREGISKKGKPT